MVIEEGVTNLIDDILGGEINRVDELTFEEVEVTVDSLLKHAAFGFDVALEGVFPDQ